MIMAIQIEAFTNSDDGFVVWRSRQQIADCIGFELRRRRNGKNEIVRNRVSFSSGVPNPAKPESSAKSPLRRFTWTDHEVNSGDKVAYQVVPVVQTGDTDPVIDESHASPFSDEVELTGKVSDSFECYFNRGFVISQFMSRLLKGDLSDKSLQAFKKSLNDNAAIENKIRVFLGGDLRQHLIDLLDEAKKSGGQIFAAIYEISDKVLIKKLTALGDRAHIVLSNGTHKSRDDDENSDARTILKNADCEIFDRMLPSGVLGHNKFIAICDKNRNPLSTWTGSTNWTPTGLCTQINNGILINNSDVAQFFIDQFERLCNAGNSTPKDLIAANSEVKTAVIGKTGVDVWFTRSSDQQEMDAVNELLKGAQQGILFLMFQPGASPILNAITARQADDSQLFVKGVISTMDKKETDQAQVSLVDRNGTKVHRFCIVQPQGLKSVGNWAAEVSRGQFLNQIGFAIVHSKVIVIDPNGDHPIVITGSHNFSAAASGKNDENLVIIRGDKALAKAYAVEIQSVYDHYNFRAVAKAMQAEGKNVVDIMKDPKNWQKNWFKGDKAFELRFWLGGD
jgi:phosphatidylserine/phosphatidylglycerophosphate/cardiolipin synthase-like enzyme